MLSGEELPVDEPSVDEPSVDEPSVEVPAEEALSSNCAIVETDPSEDKALEEPSPDGGVPGGEPPAPCGPPWPPWP